MSGGTFDYSQRTIELIADDIEQTILEAGRKIPDVLLEEQQHRYSREIPLEEQYYSSYNRKTMDIMKRAVYILRMAYIYAQRIDWMLSGDDGAVLRIEQSHFRLGQWYLQKSVLHLSYGIDLSIDLQRDGKEK